MFYLKKECCIYFNSNKTNKNDKKNINFTSINFLNNEGIINYNSNNFSNNINDFNNDFLLDNINNIKFNKNKVNKDNNISKSQMDGNNFNSNIKEYYAPPPISSSKNNKKNVNNFIQNNNNFDLIINNRFYQNSNEFDIINFDDKLDFDISPQKKNNNNPLDNNINNNLDSIEEIKKINKNDSLQFEEMTDRVEDKKRGKVIDRIVKGRAKLNDTNKNRNDLNSSNFMEKAKIYEKILGNSRRSEEFNDNIYNINNKSDNF